MSTHTRPSGTTSGERYLARLCQESFLSLWNYSNLYTDEGKKTATGSGKELCDQLVIFGNHVIIFSDKDCAYPTTPNENVNWGRYFRHAIWESAGQIWGAESWLRRYPDRIYEDAACQRPWRAKLPPAQDMVVHRILVAHGVAEACGAVYRGTGSLILDTRLVGEVHFKGNSERATEQRKPPELELFTIGHLNPAKGYVHVFDDASLLAVMRLLDTITDFVAYLERKEAYLMKPGRTVWAGGEEELLTYYLRNLDEQGEHCFPPDSPHLEVEFEDGWAEFSRSPELTRRLERDEVSYLWDNTIEFVTTHFEAQTLHYSSDPSFEAHELALRFMAAEPRLSRRALAQLLDEMLQTSPADRPWIRGATSPQRPQVRFIFLALPPMPDVEYEDYRRMRYGFLERYCRVAKLVFFEETDHIVGIGFEGGGPSNFHSVDLFYYDAREWAPQEQELARSIQNETKFLMNYRQQHRSEDEYPD